MTRAAVLQNNRRVGTLTKHAEDRYEFVYDDDYVADPEARPISYSLPLSPKSHESDKLFPFFEGLTAEGWLRAQQARLQKIDERDYFSLLLKNGEDLVGAVSVIPDDQENERTSQ